MGAFSKLSLHRLLPHHCLSVNCPHGMPPFLFNFMMVLFRNIWPIPQNPVEQADHAFQSDKMQSGLSWLAIAFIDCVSFDDCIDFLGPFRFFLLRCRWCECWSCLVMRNMYFKWTANNLWVHLRYFWWILRTDVSCTPTYSLIFWKR